MCAERKQGHANFLQSESGKAAYEAAGTALLLVWSRGLKIVQRSDIIGPNKTTQPPVAGVLFAAVMLICNLYTDKSKEEKDI